VVGRGVRPDGIDADWCARSGIPVLQRRSGGGPVLWDPDLVALDVVLPPGHPLAARDVTRAYAWLGEAIADALAGLGAPVAAVGLEEARRLQARRDAASLTAARACFGGVSPFEVLGPDDRKCVGLAQVRRARGTIFQAGIPLRFDIPGLARAIAANPAEAQVVAAALDAHVAPVGHYLPHTSADAVVTAIDAAISARIGVAYRPEPLRPDEAAAQDRIARTLGFPAA
jgi:lipoate-protein ligase A